MVPLHHKKGCKRQPHQSHAEKKGGKLRPTVPAAVLSKALQRELYLIGGSPHINTAARLRLKKS